MVWSSSRSSRAPSASLRDSLRSLLSPRSSDQGIGWSSGEAETWRAGSVIASPRSCGSSQRGITALPRPDPPRRTAPRARRLSGPGRPGRLGEAGRPRGLGRRLRAYTAPAIDSKDQPRRLRFGPQLDARPVTEAADRQEHGTQLHPETVAAYIAKYATKAAADLPTDDQHGGNRHLRRLQATLRHLAGRASFAALTDHQDPYCGWSRWLDMLGFRGHLATKSRRYSTTLGRLRQARRDYARRSYARPGDAPADWADQDHERLEETTLVVGSWRFAGMGWLTSGLSRGYLFGLHSSTPDDLGGYFRPDWS